MAPYQIKVDKTALAHLSSGIYRSPGSALRELVSNAFDAGATRVTIDTNYPNFYKIVVTDDGDGITREAFHEHMTQIGKSDKRSATKSPRFGRPVIGRLGIGLLAVAQLCQEFRIISRTGAGEVFEAHVVLSPRIREEADQPDEQHLVGTFAFVESVSLELESSGTVILIATPHPTFTRTFQAGTEAKKARRPDRSWIKNLKQLQAHSTVNELGDYWKLLFELSASSPIPYIDANCVPDGLVTAKQDTLKGWNFEVVVDGISLRKPVMLKGNDNGYTCRQLRLSETVYKTNVHIDGYIVVQEGTQLKPGELRGLLIRLKGVGIGPYDGSFLSLSDNLGPRSRWITGEIDVHNGLENSLNIDRESFNQFHPEFRMIQEYLHAQLREMFTETYRKISVRSSRRAGERRKRQERKLATALREHFSGKRVTINRSTSPEKTYIASSESGVAITLADTSELKGKRGDGDLAAVVIAIYDVCAKIKDRRERRQAFIELLFAYLSKQRDD